MATRTVKLTGSQVVCPGEIVTWQEHCGAGGETSGRTKELTRLGELVENQMWRRVSL